MGSFAGYPGGGGMDLPQVIAARNRMAQQQNGWTAPGTPPEPAAAPSLASKLMALNQPDGVAPVSSTQPSPTLPATPGGVVGAAGRQAGQQMAPPPPAAPPGPVAPDSGAAMPGAPLASQLRRQQPGAAQTAGSVANRLSGLNRMSL